MLPNHDPVTVVGALVDPTSLSPGAEMASKQETALGALRGEVVVLRELVKTLISQLPQGIGTTRRLEDALNRARATAVHMSPTYLSVDVAINQMQVHHLPR